MLFSHEDKDIGRFSNLHQFTFNRLDQICPRKVLPAQSKKNNPLDQIQRCRISLDTKFHFKYSFDFLDQMYFHSKTAKVSITIDSSTFQLIDVPNFSLNRHFVFFCDQNCPKNAETILFIVNNVRISNFSPTIKFTY